MAAGGRRLTGPARAIALAVTDAVAAAQARDAPALRAAAERLAALDRAQLAVVLGAMVRSLLEELHPEGIAEADARAVVERCARGALAWLPELDPGVLVELLTGALGLHDPDETARPPGPAAVALHAPVLLADLLGAAGRPAAGYLDAAFAEIARAETVELP